MAKNIRREIRQNREAGVDIKEIEDFESLADDFSRIFGNLFRRFKKKTALLHQNFFVNFQYNVPEC